MPSANGSNLVATAVLAPPLDPAADFEISKQFDVGPNNLLVVCPPTPNSAVLVLPMIITPLLISRSTNRVFFEGK